MKKIILLLLIVFTLSGCGIYNLNGFTLPDDMEFLAVIEELDTPKKICQYMLNNFEYHEKYTYKTLNPYELFIIKKGDCDDFSNFAKFIANYHDYETYQILMFFSSTINKHSIVVYVEDKLSFSDSQYYFSGFNNFREIVKFDCEYLIFEKLIKYIIYDYDMNIIEQRIN